MSAVYSFHQIQVICSLLDQQIRKFTAMISAPPGSHYASWLAITKQGAMSSLWTQQLLCLSQWTTHLTMRSEVSQYDTQCLNHVLSSLNWTYQWKGMALGLKSWKGTISLFKCFRITWHMKKFRMQFVANSICKTCCCTHYTLGALFVAEFSWPINCRWVYCMWFRDKWSKFCPVFLLCLSQQLWSSFFFLRGLSNSPCEFFTQNLGPSSTNE